MELGLNPSMTIELETLMRNVMVWMLTKTVLLPVVPVQGDVQSEKKARSNCEIFLTERCQCFWMRCTTRGGHLNGEHPALPDSCRCFFERIHVGAQFVPGDARCTLDLQHTQRRDFIPLCDGLLGDVQGSSELGQPAGTFDSAFQWSV